MNAATRLQNYLLKNIPLVGAMALRVQTASPQQVVLTAPLEPNRNHRDTAFGGSLAAAATLACWGIAYERTQAAGIGDAHLVVKSSSIDYLAPVSADFTCVAEYDDESAWSRVERALGRGRPARLPLSSITYSDGNVVARFTGEFAVLPSRAR